MAINYVAVAWLLVQLGSRLALADAALEAALRLRPAAGETHVALPCADEVSIKKALAISSKR
jgi:hypothetical protein